MKKAADTSFFLMQLAEFLVRLLVAGVGFSIIIFVAYLLGYQYLQAPMGNDGLNAINNVLNAARWWPQIPIWYTGQGAGVSFLWGYPLLASYLVLFLSLLSKVSLIGAFKLIGFLSLPISAMGMYVFVWRRLKNQTAGLTAGVLYLLMPVSWVWLYDWGFYAEVVSTMFFFPPLIFYDRFLEGWTKRKFDFVTRLCLVATVVSLLFTFLAHPNTFFMDIRIMLTYSPIVVLFTRKKFRIIDFIYALSPAILVMIVSILASFFISGNYQYYAKLALPRSGAGETNITDYTRDYTTPGYNFFGLGRIPQTEASFTHRNIVVPPLVWGLAIIGALSAIFISWKLVGLALAQISALAVLFIPIVAFFLVRLPFVTYFFHLRDEIMISKMMMPILAAYGIWTIPRLILKLFTFWMKFKNRFFKWFWDNLLGVVSGTVALALTVFIITNFYNYPWYMWTEDQARLGPYAFNIRDPLSRYGLIDDCREDNQEKPRFCLQVDREEGRLISYVNHACATLKEKDVLLPACEDFLEIDSNKISAYRKLVEKCDRKNQSVDIVELCPLAVRGNYNAWIKMAQAMRLPSYWPKLSFTEPYKFPFNNYDDFNKQHGNDQFLRIDVTPRGGGAIMGLNTVNKASMIDLYTVQLNLLGPYWGYEQMMLFMNGDGRVETANEVAKWFGTRFLLMHKEADIDAINKYRSSPAWVSYNSDETIWEYKDAPKLWSMTEGKPVILVVGNLKNRAFEPVFRISNKGGLPYDEFLLVDGEEYIDDYDLDTLKKFDIVMLFGYKYHNLANAWRMLDKYVSSGGSLYVSTGWQFYDSDWQMKLTPQLMPVDNLTWSTDFNKNSILKQYSDQVPETDLSTFGALEWNQIGWGISIPEKLKTWAKPILVADGKPIVAGGTYGKGKVVWTGLNLVGHMHTFEYNASEMNFFHAVFTWLKKANTRELSAIVVPDRDNPDEIKFTFTGQAVNPLFLFRESYLPNWQATLKSNGKIKNIDIYRAGPGFKLMRLPDIKKGDELNLRIVLLPPQYLYIGISIVTLAALLSYLFIGNKIWYPLIYLIRNRAINYRSKIKENWNKEE